MFWAWFIAVGLIGTVLLRNKLGGWRREMSAKALRGFGCTGLFFFFFLGILGLANATGSFFLQFATALLSWAGIIAGIELASRSAMSKLEQPEITTEASRPKPVTRHWNEIRSTFHPPAGQGQVWPPASAAKPAIPAAPSHVVPVSPPVVPRESSKRFVPNLSVSSLLNVQPRPAEAAAPPSPQPATRPLDADLRRARRSLLRSLRRQARQRATMLQAQLLQPPAPQQAAEMQPAAHTAQPTQQTTLLDKYVRPVPGLGVTSRFGAGAAASTLPPSRPLNAAEQPAPGPASQQPASRKFTYQPRLVDSKFGK